MKMFKLVGSLALIASVTTPVFAATQQSKQCMSKDQLGSLVVVLLPAAMKQLQTSCKEHLPANSALNSLNDDQIARFTQAAETAKPEAGKALRIMMGNDVPKGVDGATMLPFIESMAVAGIAGELKPEMCPVANNLWSALAPLPPENWGELIAVFAELGLAGKKADGKTEGKKGGLPPFDLCPSVAESPLAKS
jgi:hypothetical protein